MGTSGRTREKSFHAICIAAGVLTKLVFLFEVIKNATLCARGGLIIGLFF
jgi:hypothetical protein